MHIIFGSKEGLNWKYKFSKLRLRWPSKYLKSVGEPEEKSESLRREEKENF